MVYTARKDLTVLRLEEEQDTLSYNELIALLMERPSNVIYVELHGILYGMIAMGQIARSLSDGTHQVTINKTFIAVHQNENAYMCSRRLFKERDNIFFVPVLDSKGKLCGEWAKWDDLISIHYMLLIADHPLVIESLKGCEIVFVKPNTPTKRNLFSFWKQFFESREALLKIIDCRDVEQYLCKNMDTNCLVFVNQAEADGVQGRFSMLNVDEYTFQRPDHRPEFLSCQELLAGRGKNGLNGIDGAEVVFSLLKEQNVSVLAFDFLENDRGYLEEFSNKIRRKYLDHNLPFDSRIYPELREEFLCELFEKYIGLELPLTQKVIWTEDCLGIWEDTDSPFLHVSQGKRRTVEQPAQYERCIYVVGPCIVTGVYVEDQYTLSSLLQKKLNREGFNCKVINLGSLVFTAFESQIARILQEELKQGDIIVFDAYLDTNGLLFRKFPTLNLTDVLEKSQVPATWVANCPRHCNHKTNQIYTTAIYEKLLPMLRQPIKNRQPVIKDDNIVKLLYIDRYFSNFDASQYKKIGSIVMNCNPFTFGHRYLIEYASSQVDFLIIFVVQEDASLFTFKERFAMVCEGVVDLENIKVVPSGAFILSKRSFPEYFIKEADEDIVKNTENDITLFAEKIAPALGITHRFVGEEPEDPVTDLYNQAMKKILPAHGIELIEIPRKQDNEAVISASRVRKCLEENNLEVLNTLVPDSTKEILFCINE